MNLSPRWVHLLDEAGVEAVHWSEVGAPSASDVEIMAYARLHDYVDLTHDLDFSAILAATGGEKPSVAQFRSEDVRPESIGQRVIDALRQTTMEIQQGALLTVDPSRRRLRLLPLRVESEK